MLSVGMTGDQSAAAATAPVRVSVVVPVFNPGAGFDELIRSLDGQTLKAELFEVLLCDDGSDESTRHRLDGVARARPNVRVLTLAHTGWPGTPRNHGIGAARGQYVFFADQDDRLFDGALQHLCDYADRHSSDVVVGKVVGIGRRIPRRIFRRDIPRAVLGQDPLLELLTPHKLFRTSFLRENDIRFPDGRVRLEDHLFVMKAYFRASTISILASESCYAWLRNKGSASSRRIDPVTYFPHLESVLDLVELNTEPGELRDGLLRHWYRSKVLRRLDGHRMVRYPADYRARFLDVVTPLARSRFGPSVERGLPLPLRIRSALLRAGRRDELIRFVEFEAELTCVAEAMSARWTHAGRLTLTVQVRIVDDDGHDGLVFHVAKQSPGSRIDPASEAVRPPALWRPPERLGPDFIAREARDASEDLGSDRIEVLLLGEQNTERRIAVSPLPNLRAANVTIDPLKVFGRHDPSVGGRLSVHVRHAGWIFEAPLRADRALVAGVGRSPLPAGRRHELDVTQDGTVALRRDWPQGRLKDLAARAIRRAGSTGRRVLRRRSGSTSGRG
jgi:poly(ribitol-phosphate) beta-N-acetylglucosaminyltransferase